MKKTYKILLTAFLLTIISAALTLKANAVDVAPRITDREIIESLAELKKGQADLNKRIDDINTGLNKRIDDLQDTMLSLFGAIIALIIALFGYIAWDRRTMVKPLQERLEHIEMVLHHDLDIRHKDGSLLTRLVNALKELAKTDKKVAEVLRTFSLM